MALAFIWLGGTLTALAIALLVTRLSVIRYRKHYILVILLSQSMSFRQIRSVTRYPTRQVAMLLGSLRRSGLVGSDSYDPAISIWELHYFLTERGQLKAETIAAANLKARSKHQLSGR
jgi:hypothetical protein